MAMAAANLPPLITDCYRSCITTFERITTGLGNPAPDSGLDFGSPEAKALALRLVQDQRGRLRVWAGNMGAHHPASSRMSLDYKLKEASHIRNMVVKLLEQLSTSLESAYLI